MKVIYAFKKLNKEHYKPQDETFFKLAKLSVEMAKKYYSTKLYCDKESLKMFNYHNIKFDEVEVLDSIEEYTGSLSCMSKILAMMEQTEPYIMCDFDCVILQHIPNVSTIKFAYPETVKLHLNTVLYEGRPDDYINYLDKYYATPYNIHKNKFNDWFVVDPDSSPNNCIVMVNSPIMIREVYKDILSKFTDEEMDNTGPMFIEQFLLYHYLKNFRIDVDYITTGWKNPNTMDYQMLMEKFIHFMDYDKDSIILDKIDYLAKNYNIKL